MANVSNASGVFTGINEMHVVKGGFADGFTLASGQSLVEVPVAEESGFTYTGGTPSTERYRIHGLSAPWAIKMTPGDAEANLFIPQITQSILELFGFSAAAAAIAKNALSTSHDVLKNAWSGITWGEASKEVVIGVAAINRTADQLFGIKKIQVLASIIFDDANSAKPIGIQLTGASTGGAATDALGLFTIAAGE